MEEIFNLVSDRRYLAAKICYEKLCEEITTCDVKKQESLEKEREDHKESIDEMMNRAQEVELALQDCDIDDSWTLGM